NGRVRASRLGGLASHECAREEQGDGTRWDDAGHEQNVGEMPAGIEERSRDRVVRLAGCLVAGEKVGRRAAAGQAPRRPSRAGEGKAGERGPEAQEQTRLSFEDDEEQ